MNNAAVDLQQEEGLDPGAFRPYQDNVLLLMDPIPDQTKSGLHIVQREASRRGHRTATVVAVGPGHRGIPCWSHPEGAEIPTQVRPGDKVVVDALAGQAWDKRFDRSVPRHNGSKGELLLQRGEYRIVREGGEILGVIEDEQ